MLTMRIYFYCQLVVIAAILAFIPPTVRADNHSKPPHRKLKSASELDYPPFALVRPDGSADGFSVDLLKAVVQAMGLEVNFSVGPWHEIKQKLEERHIDVLPLVAYAKERDKMFDFTVPYLRMHGTIFVRKGEKSIHSEADLKDKEALVMRSDAAHEYVVRENLSNKLVLTDSFEEAMKLLSEGKHDAVVVQQLVGLQLIKKLGISNVVNVSAFQETSLKPFGKPLSGFEQKFCFAVQDGDGELLALLNEGLAIVFANGTYNELYKRWFSPILPHPPIPFTVLLKYLAFILIPILFLMAFGGILYFKREVRQKTQSLREEVKERRKTEEELRESERELSVRNRIADIFLTTHDHQMYGEVLQVVLEAMESPYGTFAYINEDGDRIVPSMTRDIWDECKMPAKGIFFPRDKWGDTLWAKCLIEKKSFSSNGPFTVPDGHIQITRAMATPIIYQGESVGNLMVGDKPTDYSEKDKKLLETIADHIAPILHSKLLNERHEEKRKLAEKQIRASLQEKEVLLREIHHRVKNNMQVISSLLKLQANNAKDERITEALMESQGRVQTMATVHETLYDSDNLASIDFESFISELTKTIFQSYGTSRNQVTLKIEAEDIKFGIEQATPISLLINELVSNALKHAFPENRKGHIIIRFQAVDPGAIELIVSDNGIGLPEDFDWRHTDTLGLKLVTILAENQLNGTINLNRDNGTHFTIRFKLKEIG